MMRLIFVSPQFVFVVNYDKLPWNNVVCDLVSNSLGNDGLLVFHSIFLSLNLLFGDNTFGV